MLGFNPFSDLPISSIELPVITGTINVTDENDTADIQAALGQVTTGEISATDENDTASITATVTAGTITGTISVTDENDTANIIAVNEAQPSEMDMHDGFTKEEVKRFRKLQKKLNEAQQKLIEEKANKDQRRKQAIADVVDPKPIQVKKTELESDAEVKIDTPSIDLNQLNATIINLQRQQEQLLKTVELRNRIAQVQAMLAIHEAQLAAERDDEEALLLLI